MQKCTEKLTMQKTDSGVAQSFTVMYIYIYSAHVSLACNQDLPQYARFLNIVLILLGPLKHCGRYDMACVIVRGPR